MRPVYIVGAGPGDPTLISLRGHRLLKEADVVVHDHLVHPRLLRSGPPDAEYIDVGEAAPREVAQDAICLLLVEKAREGKQVVRLKWGDPFVFDSGGKEALFLHENGIPFEVVPGVPALVAHAAYAGIPLTYPEAGDALVFVRGYEDGTNTPPGIDWECLTRLEGSIACAPSSSSRSTSSPACSRARVTTIRRPNNGRASNQRRCSRKAATRPTTNTAGCVGGALSIRVASSPSVIRAVACCGSVPSVTSAAASPDEQPLSRSAFTIGSS